MKKIFTPLTFTLVLFFATGISAGYAQVANDAGITSVTPPVCTPGIDFTLTNLGNNNITTVTIGWSVNGTYQTPNSYNQTLTNSFSVNLVLSPDYNFVNGNTYTVKVFTYSPNNVSDGDKSNDTSKITFTFSAKKPYGAAFIKGTPFQTPSPNTTGTITDPDRVTAGNKLTYEIQPPTGFSNSGYGSTWIGMTPVLKSAKGMYIDPKAWNYTPPSGTSLGKLTFSPDKDLEDTCLSITLLLKELSTPFCDSTITRHICVVKPAGIDFKSHIINNGFSVYPNPSGGNFTITIDNPQSDINISVYNLVGELVETMETKPLAAVYALDLKAANGIYILKVYNGGFISAQKIVVNRL